LVLMVRNIWDWFACSSNSTALQAVGTLLSVLVGVVTVGVLIVTWKAIKRQAEAAEEQEKASRALIEAAMQQTIATIEAAAAAKEQSRLLALQYEQGMAPLIVGRLGIGGPGNKWTMLELKNVGAGTAFGVVVIKGKVELGVANKTYPTVEFSPSTLGSGEGGSVPLDTTIDGFMTVQYRGADRIERHTIVSNQNGFRQEHWVQRGLQFIGL
jgi:hypothetical protein